MTDAVGEHVGEPFVLRSDDGPIATLTLNRPLARNPLSFAMLEALCARLDELATDPVARVVIVTGAGPAFSSGHDLRELAANEDPAFHRLVFETCSTVMQRLAALPQAVIAQVHGIATAAGCQLVATCDLAVAGTSARFATPGVNIGLFCSTPGVAVSRSVAPKHAMQLLLTGEAISAADAFRMGLINQVVPDEQVAAKTWELAELIASKSASVIASGKATFRRQHGLPLANAYDVATESMVTGIVQPSAREGIGAFLDKRAPVWPDESPSGVGSPTDVGPGDGLDD